MLDIEVLERLHAVGKLSTGELKKAERLFHDAIGKSARKWRLELSEDGRLEWVESRNEAPSSPNSLVTDDVVGNNLRRLREYAGKGQGEVSGLISVSQQAYSKYERGQRSLPLDSLMRLARYYDVSVEEILLPPRGLRDAAGYKPYASAAKKIVIAIADAVDCEAAAVSSCTEAGSYKRLYAILDGKSPLGMPVGIAKASDGRQALVVSNGWNVGDDSALEDAGKREWMEQSAVDAVEFLLDNEPTEHLEPDISGLRLVRYEPAPDMAARVSYERMSSDLLAACLEGRDHVETEE